MTSEELIKVMQEPPTDWGEFEWKLFELLGEFDCE